jgi:hypothetical protein
MNGAPIIHSPSHNLTDRIFLHPMNSPRRPLGGLQFGFTGMFLLLLAVANTFAGFAYLLKASRGNTLDITIFFGFVLLGPFILAMIAGLLRQVFDYFNDK